MDSLSREEEAGDPKKIKAAHRRLAKLNHPDSGGSHYIASKINEAKTVLVNAMEARIFEEEKKKKEQEDPQKQGPVKPEAEKRTGQEQANF